MIRQLQRRPLTETMKAALAPLPHAGPATDLGAYGAANGDLIWVSTAAEASGFSGNGYVSGFDDEANQVVVTAPSGDGASFPVTVGYRSPFSVERAQLLMNGATARNLTMPGPEATISVPTKQKSRWAGDDAVTATSKPPSPAVAPGPAHRRPCRTAGAVRCRGGCHSPPAT